VAKVATKLLSLTIFGDHTLINYFNITRPDFLKLKKKVLELGGTVTQLDLYQE